MSTLADEFLNDINDSDEDDDEQVSTTTTTTNNASESIDGDIQCKVVDPEEDDKGDQDDLMLTDDQIDKKQNDLISNLKDAPLESIAKLKGSNKLNNILERVNVQLNQQLPNKGEKTAQGTTEHQLIVECNAMVQDIQHEIYLIHKYVRERYSIKFPELDSTVQNPLDYINVVKRIGNQSDLTQVDLNDLLPKATIMVLLVTFSSTTGKPLSEKNTDIILNGCDMALELDSNKKLILSYLESRMSFIAPNLSVLLGSSIAARLIGIAGGVQNLSVIPAGNLQTFGASKKHLEGFSGMTNRRFQSGLISQCEIVKKAPPYLQKKAIRVLTGKVSICARVDAQQETSLYGETGRQFRDLVMAQIEKWQEPPPVKQIKALPAPDDRPKKKRGGKRARAYKQKYQTTDLRKAQNRMAFGVEEKTTADGEVGMGMIGGETGKVRLMAQDRGILKKKKIEQKDYGSGQLTMSGLQSVMITPVTGLQLAVGEQSRTDSSSATAKKDRYFSGAQKRKAD
ncbi:hypothetical protein PPL_01739 [Heterostelium album PN500]|uniref:Nop domain-containing protein n=1 Tax=Heterostelium pallidum (strain ATCC 26659 / Pp 5 / PN500) TaxID=670386 RepID=D3B0C3_HETP5|nr:hypothetical protein PPL_01739 [Heterostelium album PN500]EFA84747.1 hypothetical protein PPL_01739 [Heterostelium album PN500]|eukprot:XP_020436859.1 hypothetical protein PPL_01739 [Heterostelium album PN500]